MRLRHAALAALLTLAASACTGSDDLDDGPPEAAEDPSGPNEELVVAGGNRLCDAVTEIERVLLFGVDSDDDLADAYAAMSVLYADIAAAIPDADARTETDQLSRHAEVASDQIREATDLDMLEASELFESSESIAALRAAMEANPDGLALSPGAVEHINDECTRSLPTSSGDEYRTIDPSGPQAAAANAIRQAVPVIETQHTTAGTYDAAMLNDVADVPAGVTLDMVRADTDNYCLEARHTDHEGVAASWDSADSGVAYDRPC